MAITVKHSANPGIVAAGSSAVGRAARIRQLQDQFAQFKRRQQMQEEQRGWQTGERVAAQQFGVARDAASFERQQTLQDDQQAFATERDAAARTERSNAMMLEDRRRAEQMKLNQQNADREHALRAASVKSQISEREAALNADMKQREWNAALKNKEFDLRAERTRAQSRPPAGAEALPQPVAGYTAEQTRELAALKKSLSEIESYEGFTPEQREMGIKSVHEQIDRIKSARVPVELERASISKKDFRERYEAARARLMNSGSGEQPSSEAIMAAMQEEDDLFAAYTSGADFRNADAQSAQPQEPATQQPQDGNATRTVTPERVKQILKNANPGI